MVTQRPTGIGMSDWRNQKGKPRTRPLEERFWEKVNIPHGGFGCWMWDAADGGSSPYGVILRNGRPDKAHRVSWVLCHKSEVPEGMLVCHHCDNPKCVNPSHLFLGTAKDNADDMMRKGRGRSVNWRGEEHPRTRLSEDDVRSIKSQLCDGVHHDRDWETGVKDLRT